MRPMRDWLAAGLVQVDGRAFGAGQRETPLMLLAPAGTYGPMFLTTRNFQVIKAYNFADLYALFVGHLANRIAGGREQQIVGPWGAVTPMAERDAQEIQGHLRADGFEIEKLDGKVGTKTRSALGLYQKRHGLKLDCWPTPATLAFMRKTAAGRTGAPAAPTPASAPLGGRR